MNRYQVWALSGWAVPSLLAAVVSRCEHVPSSELLGYFTPIHHINKLGDASVILAVIYHGVEGERRRRGNKRQKGKSLRAWGDENSHFKIAHFSQFGGAGQEYRLNAVWRRYLLSNFEFFQEKKCMHIPNTICSCSLPPSRNPVASPDAWSRQGVTPSPHHRPGGGKFQA